MINLFPVDNRTKIKQESVVLVDELIQTAKEQGPGVAVHPHGWLDNNRWDPWDRWEVYIQDKNTSVWKATLHIANASSGEKILYDVRPTKMVEQHGNSRTSTTNNDDSTPAPKINTPNSLVLQILSKASTLTLFPNLSGGMGSSSPERTPPVMLRCRKKSQRTNIRNITQDITASYGVDPLSSFLHDASKNEDTTNFSKVNA